MQKKIRLLCFLVASVLLVSVHSGFSQSVNHWEMVVASGDTWSYFPGNSEPPFTWPNTDFETRYWASGPGGIGYGDNDDATVIGNVTSLYMRLNFTITDTSDISWAILHMDYDDAFVAYLNGHELARANIGTAGVRPFYNQTALADHEAKVYAGGIPDRFIIHKDTVRKYLTNGVNTLALQVHNISAGSSDLTAIAYFSVGMKTPGQTYRPVPSWFNDPVTEKTNLPLLIINTYNQEIPDEPKITASLKVVDNGPGNMNGFLDDATGYEGPIGIEIRGQSSQQFPKKGYGVELWTAAGADTSVSLLGMPADEDWVLSAPYSDKTMLRNAITYELGRKMGNWQPGFRWCEVYLNGSYNGVYMLVEKIKRSAGRVDINKLKPDEISGDDLTGGYIVKVDKTWGLTANEYFNTYPSNRYYNARTYTFTYVYPDYDVIVSQQKSYIQNYMLTLENTLNGASFKDPVNGFRKYMDVGSFVDFQVINEFANNVDGYRYSTFFYKKKDSDGGKLFAGPIWDFDLSYGNVDYFPMNLATEGWLYPHYGPNDGYPMHWWARLMEDEDYRQAFAKRWKALRAGPLNTDSVMNDIDEQTRYLDKAIARNFSRWPILGVYVWPNYFVGATYIQEIDYLKNWMRNRLQWLDGNVSLSTGDLVSDNQGYHVSVFPNPVKDQLNIAVTLPEAHRVEIEIVDVPGKAVFKTLYSPDKKGLQVIEQKIPYITSGYYLLKLIQDGRVIGVQKLIVSN